MTVSKPQEFGALTVCLMDDDYPDDSWYLLNSVVRPQYGHDVTFLGVKETHPADTPLLKPPISFTYIGTTQSGENVWRPVAPDGYRAFTDIIGAYGDPNDNPSAFRWSVCVREGQQSDGHTYVYADAPVEKMVGFYEGCWLVAVPQYVGDVDGILLSGGESVIYSPHGEPVDTPVQNLLNLPPSVVEGPPPILPVMDSYEMPDLPPPSTDRRVLVPCSAIEDGMPIEWKLENSPYYTVIRKRGFSEIGYLDNQFGTDPESKKYSVSYGVTDTQSETFSASVGVTVGFEAGVDIFVAEAKVSASLTVNLGYQSSTAVTEMQSTTIENDLNVGPKHAGAMLAETHTIDVLREDHTSASSTGPLIFDALTDTYYLSYPPPEQERP
ncbi:hypothetical protein ACFCYH_33015 [Streptomyces sp. NPDC056400]|uniref:hypothetical protein n=1 Tax=Streptomyces sp. NPDC056400 TaxID=3345808 RepID=UPI0035DD9BB4